MGKKGEKRWNRGESVRRGAWFSARLHAHLEAELRETARDINALFADLRRRGTRTR